VDRRCGPGPLVHDGPVTDREGVAIRAVGFAIYGCGRTHAMDGGARPTCGGARRRLLRKFAGDGDLGATVHYLRHGLNREKEEDGAELTSGSLTAVGRCRRRAVMRGGRDHGCPPGRGLRPRLRASERWDEPLVYLCMRG
jgi:hypothetical protein